MRLAVLYEDSRVYAEYAPDTFRRMLIEEFAVTNSVGRAFDRVAEKLKKQLLRK